MPGFFVRNRKHDGQRIIIIIQPLLKIFNQCRSLTGVGKLIWYSVEEREKNIVIDAILGLGEPRGLCAMLVLPDKQLGWYMILRPEFGKYFPKCFMHMISYIYLHSRLAHQTIGIET
jgi:hypothetical protein